MAAPVAASTSTPPRPVLVVAAILAGVAIWYFMGAYTSAGARECGTLYRAARTAADSAVVDATYPPAGRRETQPRNCGFLRTSARWQ
ncbi:MAG: hypothetical protein AB7L66_16140 [Gemmatimonadales bacterium]